MKIITLALLSLSLSLSCFADGCSYTAEPTKVKLHQDLDPLNFLDNESEFEIKIEDEYGDTHLTYMHVLDSDLRSFQTIFNQQDPMLITFVEPHHMLEALVKVSAYERFAFSNILEKVINLKELDFIEIERNSYSSGMVFSTEKANRVFNSDKIAVEVEFIKKCSHYLRGGLIRI